MKKLFIISGGVGSEREVSLSSGKNVADTLSQEGIEYESIIVDSAKNFIYGDTKMTEKDGIIFLKKKNALVFQLIHGTYGEDGELVKKLEDAGIICIGTRASALELTIDKYETERVLKENNVTTPYSVLVKRGQESIVEDELSNMPFPVIVKPKKEGSSVGVIKVMDRETLRSSLSNSLVHHEEVLVQQYLSGREFTCGAVEIDGKETALTPTEVILTKGELFDYEAKYSEGGCLEITPAQVDAETSRKIQELALLSHKVTGCRDISRTDMMMNEKGELAVLEINTIPGMTKTSFVPAELAASGYTISDFVRGMLEKYS